MFKFWSSPCLTQCPFYHTPVLRDEVGRCQTDQMDHGWGWVLVQSVNPTICNLALYFLAPLFPHLSNEDVGLDDFQGLLQLEHSIILSLCSDK